MANAKNKGSISKKSKFLILFGFAFFINPLLRGLDLLPDIFGCLLIYFGLTQSAYFDGAIEKARKCFLYLAVVEGIRLLLMRSVFLTPIGSNRMLAVTSFAIVDGIVYFMMFRQLFNGINYYSMRNNCNKTLAKCDGTAFITNLAFFTRLGASVIPELLSISELYLYAEDNINIDFETLDAIADLMVAKPLIEIFFFLLSLGISIAWFVSMCGLMRTFFGEAGEKMDMVYEAEYTSHPEKTRPKKMRNAMYVLYLALFFALDLVLDGIRYIPASAMFLFMSAAMLFFKGVFDFTKTKKLAPIAFILLLGAEAYRAVLLPTNVIVIYQIEWWICAIGAVLCIAAAFVCLLTVRYFLAELQKMSKYVGGGDISVQKPWIAYCISAVLWSVGYAVPYFYSYVSSARLIASGIFIWQTVKILGYITESEEERIALYGK